MMKVLNPLLHWFSSLKLTVVLLALSIFLIFAGTWAQIDLGIWTVLSTYFRAWIVFIPVQIFLPRQWDVPGVIPYPGGFTLGWMLFLNLVTAHAVRFKWQWKRAGLILIHLGLLLLIVGEFVTAISAEENRMTIVEGGTVNYAVDIREVELAVIDRSAPDVDQVVAVPGHRLAKGRMIRDERLPFDIRVEAYHQNAEIMEGVERTGGTGQADMGFAAGRAVTLRPVPPASGTDRDRSDLPAAVVTLEKNGQRLGTWIVSLYLTLTDVPPQPVTVDGRTVDLTLRFKRVYKSYSMSLIDFRHDKYPGTETPMNYSSDVRLVDAAHGEDRQVRIYMNNPLRYRGETFYQSSFLEGDAGTVLQVVRNPGWLLPYLACAIGAFGLMIHFGTRLTSFLRRRSAA